MAVALFALADASAALALPSVGRVYTRNYWVYYEGLLGGEKLVVQDGGDGRSVSFRDFGGGVIIENSPVCSARSLSWVVCYLHAGYQGVTVLGGLGNDVLDARGWIANAGVGDRGVSLRGGDGADLLLSGSTNDGLDGGSGADLIRAGGGNDWLVGSAGADRLYGESGDDVLWDDDIFLEGVLIPDDDEGPLPEDITLFHSKDLLDCGPDTDYVIRRQSEDTVVGCEHFVNSRLELP